MSEIIVFGLVLLAILIVLYFQTKKLVENKEIKDRNKQIEEENEQLFEKNINLLKESETTRKLLEDLEKSKNRIEEKIEKDRKRSFEYHTLLLEQQKTIEENAEHHREKEEKLYRDYISSLDLQIEKAKQENEYLLERMKTAYEEEQDRHMLEFQKTVEQLNSLVEMKESALAALKKEEALKSDLEFYSLDISERDKHDIKLLEDVKINLNNPRVLSMLVWSTYFQKPMNELCNRVLGLGKECGIYKITNQKDNKVYIGQSVDIATRFKSHAKCGLGIDTPQGNKLYKAMIKDGLWNFTFELLEACPQNDLNQKEKFYIDLYKSYDYGYNSTKGNS